MSSLDFETLEDTFQGEFDKIELPYEPDTVVTVDLQDFRNISVGLSDWVDTPDPQFHVSCPLVKRKHLRHFKTQSIGSDVTSGSVGETFKFVIPKDHSPKAQLPIEIKLYDIDYGLDDFIGKTTIDAAELPDDGTVISKTLVFGKKNGELDIKISKLKKSKPDIRYSVGLCPEEREFRKKRLPIIFEAMKKVLQGKGPKKVIETPIVSLVCSGGGYRAIVGMCGAMEALTDAGLLDICTYVSGVSGSSWYLASAYTLQGMKASEQKEFHKKVRERISRNLVWDMASPLTHNEYLKNDMNETIRKYQQPHSFVNFFPGFMVGKHILQEKMSAKLSDMIPYVENAEVPYPLLVALHVKNRAIASQYHAYVERGPYEISIPSYGINLKPHQEGSTWYAGYLVRKCPELPVFFTIGMAGCAFSILLNAFLNDGGEVGKDFAKFVESKRLEGKKQANESLDENRTANIESDDEDDDDDDDAEVNLTLPDGPNESVDDSQIPANEKQNDIFFIRKLIRKTSFFSSRNAIIGRTARVFNVALGFDSITRHFLNPFGVKTPLTGDAATVIDACGMDKPKNKISTTKNILSFADAGVLKNVPTDVVLRPQRTTDLMIVMDFNGYESDDNFNYEPLLTAAAHAWQSGLEFPKINFEEITNTPPKDFLIFPSDGPKCPTVLWITLSNCKFKQDEKYDPKSTAEPPKGTTRKFNDFQVFGKETPFSTFSFQYSNYHFDQLKELMYYNVTNHIQDIKDALIETVVKKRERRT